MPSQSDEHNCGEEPAKAGEAARTAGERSSIGGDARGSRGEGDRQIVTVNSLHNKQHEERCLHPVAAIGERGGKSQNDPDCGGAQLASGEEGRGAVSHEG